jgi:hypothetical protein
MAIHANDNVKPRQRQDPLHRLYAEERLDPFALSKNEQLYNIGLRYRRTWDQAKRPTSEYEPPTFTTQYDEYRDCQVRVIEKPVDIAGRLYFAAASALEPIMTRNVFEAIVLHQMPVDEAGQKFLGRKHTEQARAAATENVRISLVVLKSHYALQPIILAKAS